MRAPFDAVVIGASWGALTALRTILGGLPRDFNPAVIIVPHRGRDQQHLLPHLLRDVSPLPLSEIEDKDPVEAGHVYLAPADYHVLVDADRTFELSVDEPVRYSRPSIDVAFHAVADVYRDRSIGVVLTGANEDGARGLRRIVDRGGHAIVQDPSTAEVSVMPAAAIRAVPDATVLPLNDIAPHLVTLMRPLPTEIVR